MMGLAEWRTAPDISDISGECSGKKDCKDCDGDYGRKDFVKHGCSLVVLCKEW